MPFIVSADIADRLRQLGPLPPDFVVTAGPSARWPLDQPWPPQVTVPGKPCWQCATRTR
jgi:hypothetical protein